MMKRVTQAARRLSIASITDQGRTNDAFEDEKDQISPRSTTDRGRRGSLIQEFSRFKNLIKYVIHKIVAVEHQ